MELVSYALAALAVSLTILALLVPVADKLGLPFPTVVAIVGLALGSISMALGISPSASVLEDYEAWFFDSIAFDSHNILYVFLPPLLFEMSLSVDVRRLIEDLVVVFLMAVVAVFAATLFVGGALFYVSQLNIIVCLLLGATISTTDPAAVVTIFRKIGAPRRLLVILEGESLLNDAAAIALYAILLAGLAPGAELSVIEGAFAFVYGFGVGALVGAAFAYAASRIYPLLRGDWLAEMTLSVATAYAAFLTAEPGFHASGVVAVVVAGLTTVVVGTVRMGPGNWPVVHRIWTQVGFWASGLILLIGSVLTPEILADPHWYELIFLVVVIIGAFGARAVVLFIMLPVLSHVGLTTSLTRPQKTLVWWGGARGAVTLILALSLAEAQGLSEFEQRLMGALGCGFVIFTLLVNASTLEQVTRFLGLDRLSRGDRMLRNRIVAATIREAARHSQVIAEQRRIEPQMIGELQASYESRARVVEGRIAYEPASFGERLRLGLTMLASQESRIVRRQFDDRVIESDMARLLRINADRLADAARLGGREGYEWTMDRILDFPRSFLWALNLQRYLNLQWPLAFLLSQRFDMLFETETVLQHLMAFNDERTAPFIGEDATVNLRQLIEKRSEIVRNHLDALELQYPRYAQGLRAAFLQRAGLRWEQARYERLQREGIVGDELFRALMSDVGRIAAAARKHPVLDVGLQPERLIAAVPMFMDLSSSDRRWLLSRMKTRFVAPGEYVVRTGDRGNEMYFVGSGALEVRIPPAPVRLSNGDFFGELALIGSARRRTADVIALGYCRLLVLNRRDFRKLIERSPQVSRHIQDAAGERTAAAGSRPATKSPTPPTRVRIRRPRRTA